MECGCRVMFLDQSNMTPLPLSIAAGAATVVRTFKLRRYALTTAPLPSLTHEKRRTTHTVEAWHPRIALALSPAAPIVTPMVHSGIGYDVHALVEGRKLILGGVDIPYHKGLDGHSDADALMHAICDAVLGAIGEPDIGHFFPNTDPRWKGVASSIFLVEAAKAVKAKGGTLVNVDATVIAQAPKIYPHIASMKTHIATALGIPVQKVGIKATTNELMGFIGRGEGIAAMAIATVDLP